jgi:hypothetical protein
MSTQQTTLDHAKVNEFLGKAIQDVAATFHAGLVRSGTGSACTGRWPGPAG